MVWINDDIDLINPTSIEHHVDEIRSDNVLEQLYNFIDYHFERNGSYMMARTYLHSIEDVIVHGPFDERGSERPVSAPELENAVMAYLSRRFPKVTRW